MSTEPSDRPVPSTEEGTPEERTADERVTDGGERREYVDRPPQPRRPKKSQVMKPETAAKKLGILLAAAPAEFTASPITREGLDELNANPPEWLVTLRTDGPHPRQVVAGKLGVSTSGLARAGVTEPLTSAEIKALLEAPPAWLVEERAVQAQVRAEQVRVKERDRERAARRAEK